MILGDPCQPGKPDHVDQMASRAKVSYILAPGCQVPWHLATLVLGHLGALVPWYLGILGLGHLGIVASWYLGTLMPWFFGVLGVMKHGANVANNILW